MILDKIKEATKEDTLSKKLTETIMTENWRNVKRDRDLALYHLVKGERYMVNNVFRMN